MDFVRGVSRAGLLTATLVALGPPAARAGKAVGYFSGGAGVPEAPSTFSDGWNPTFGVSVGVGFRPGPWLEVGGSFGLDRFSSKPEGRTEILLPGEDLTDATVRGGDTSILLLQGEFRAFLPISLSRVSPYLVGAGGLLRRTFEEVAIDRDGVEELVSFEGVNAFVLSPGAGVGFRLTRELWFTLEGSYAIGFTEGEHTRYFPLRAGLAFH